MNLFRGKIKANAWADGQLQKLKSKAVEPNTIGYRLNLYRISLGFKGQEMAAHIGFSPGSYSELASNKTAPSCATIRNIMLLKECDTRWLITGE